LSTWTPAGHNGTVRGKKYFSAADGRGYFTRRESITNVVVPVVKSIRHRRKSKTYKLQPLKLGNRVRFIKDNDERTGVIRYIGCPSFTEGEVIGIELDQWSINAHDGTVNEIHIFDAAPGRGVFCRRDQIKKNLHLGDTVILKQGRKGHVKYIGVELDSWDPEAGDGTYKGYRFFTTPEARGVFVSRNAIIEVKPLEEESQNNSIINDNEKAYKLGTRVVIDLSQQINKHNSINNNRKKKYNINPHRRGTIRYVGQNDNGKDVYGIELDIAVEFGTDGRYKKKRYFNCRPGHAIFIIHDLIIEILDEDEVIKYKINDRVKLTNGRMGIIEKIEAANENDPIYQISVDPWDAKRNIANDQETILSKRRYSGTFRKDNKFAYKNRSFLVDNSLIINEIDDNNDNDSGDNNDDYSIGDTVKLVGGKKGTVRYIGTVTFDDSCVYVGIELHSGIGKVKNDQSSQYLTRKCPECGGDFIKCRNPQLAYNSVMVVVNMEMNLILKIGIFKVEDVNKLIIV